VNSHADAVRAAFGDRVAGIVLACTDGSHEEKAQAESAGSKRANGEARQRRYLAHLEEASANALLMSGCDKLHNLRAILSDLHDPAVGEKVFDRFTGARDGKLWYYRELAAVFARKGHPAARELEQAVGELEGVQQ
jgi:(p)ppGpp synthase/HD superfamily hydrolase